MVWFARPSVCLAHLFEKVLVTISSCRFQESWPWSREMSVQKIKFIGQTSRTQSSNQILPKIGRCQITLVWFDAWQISFTHGFLGRMRGAQLFFKVICEISSLRGRRSADLPQSWAFLDDYSSSNWGIGIKLGPAILEAYERCPVVFKVIPQLSRSQGPKKSADLTPIWAFLDDRLLFWIKG